MCSVHGSNLPESAGDRAQPRPVGSLFGPPSAAAARCQRAAFRRGAESLPLKHLQAVATAASAVPAQALASAGIAWDGGGLETLDRMRCGILVGTAMGGMHTFATAIEAMHTQASGLLAHRCRLAIATPAAHVAQPSSGCSHTPGRECAFELRRVSSQSSLCLS